MTERRHNPLTGDWVLVSPARLNRPWRGGADMPAPSSQPTWAADCHLCPRNQRAGGHVNPDYSGVFAFDNDFPALDEHAAARSDGLLRVETQRGRCRVLCYSERHDLDLGNLPLDGIGQVIGTWQRETLELGETHAWVQVFENRGAMMGASSPHPHGQIWATSTLPSLVEREDRFQRDYRTARGRSLLVDYADREQRAVERIVIGATHWLVVVPFWAAWPFETLVVPRRECGSLVALSSQECDELARVIGQLARAYDSLFGVPFPYSMGWHGTPRGNVDHWQLHAHFYPPLLRSAAVRKHMVGYELLAEVQRDLSPEQAAERLRAAISLQGRPD